MAEQDALIDSTTAPAETSCCCCCNPERNISHEFIHEHLKGNPLFGWWHMPKLQPWDVLDKLRLTEQLLQIESGGVGDST
ncbi:hypothetical protein AK812_SmicGene7412 [Symbiodinium microadriaticum]|uniref:Uncharacterized protein n=1 Tax=Symbiodinium microadriaticum TaxID=2951 RepID=A0A1Q9ENM0_SYMMI|nr:hypothetical protein AK812_SmicGene7412 [Symbiodinium microadriaticum]